ncbi:MAG TPA: methyltransferase domain-containing protein [Acetobacteraceae bacterium]|nr:methyltransferase domain-containing protein [Acetobacteraceae bacterium]
MDSAFARNRRFYDPLWAAAQLIPPQRFNTWRMIRRLLPPAGGARLEIGPGLRPRLPLADSDFLDASPAAAAVLRAAGGRAVVGSADALPYRSGMFGLIVALDVIEHVADDAAAFAELTRVAAPGAALVLSVPLDPARWSRFDEAVGHCRRYRIEELGGALARLGWRVEASASFGLRPRLPGLAAAGMWMLAHHPERAMWWYNRLLPRALRRQQRLATVPGLAVPARRTDEVLLIARLQTTSR